MVECERSSNSILSRGVIGLGMPGMYPGAIRNGTGETLWLSGSGRVSEDMATTASTSPTVDVSEMDCLCRL